MYIVHIIAVHFLCMQQTMHVVMVIDIKGTLMIFHVFFSCNPSLPLSSLSACLPLLSLCLPLFLGRC